MVNLDLFAARRSQEILTALEGRDPAEVERLVVKALGVLQENGVYAAALFLESRAADNERDASKAEPATAKAALGSLFSFFSDLDLGPVPGNGATERFQFLTEKVLGDLDTLLLVKQVWEQTLIYTRYSARARQAGPQAQ
jgi:hypothetical protein